MRVSADKELIKILLVEDNPGDVLLVQKILKETSQDQFELTSVEQLTEVAAKLAENSIDVILLDLSLPDAAGLEALTRMRAAAPYLPIVILTGNDDETLAFQALRGGAQDYLLKDNLDSVSLRRVLRKAIERKRADQAQRENEERFRALVQHSTDIILILAANGAVLYESPSVEELMGYRPEDVRGLNITEVVHADDLHLILKGRRTILAQQGASFSCEVRLRHANGSWRTQEMTMTNLLNHPAIHGIVVNSRDITERRQTEEALRFQAQLLNTVGEAVIATNMDNLVTYWNHFAETLYGWSTAEAVGSNIMNLTVADTSHEQAAAIMTSLRSGESWQGEFTVQRRDGVKFPVLVTDTPILDKKGALIGVIGVSQDITERKRAENILQQYTRRIEVLHNIDRGILTAQSPEKNAENVVQPLMDLIHCDAVRIIAIDPHDNTLAYAAAYPSANQASQDSLRKAIEQYGLPDSFRRGEVLLIDDIKTHVDLWVGFEEILSRGKARSWIIAPLIADEALVGILAAGSFHPFAFTSEHVEIAREFADQLAIALHKTHLDKQIQEYALSLEARVAERTEQLRSAKERSDAILMSASDAMIVANMEGGIEQVNTAFTALFGYTLEQGRAVSLFELLDSANTDTVHRVLDEIVEGGLAKRVELIGTCRDGRLFDAAAAFSRVDDRQPTTLICSIRDITARKQEEENLRRALVKERELGDLKMRFVSMVSHEFRNPLSSILSSSDLMKFYSDRMSDDKKLEHLERIQLQVKHLTDLLEDVLFMSRAESVGVQINLAVADFVAFCLGLTNEFQSIEQTHEFQFVSTEAELTMPFDAKLMRQIVTNLLSNAAKYSPAGSIIHVNLIREQSSTILRVQDQGIGIPEKDQKHLFELFHRAGNVGTTPGTGLGLTIVKRGVEAHGGTVTVESLIGIGTTLTVRLPLAPGTS